MTAYELKMMAVISMLIDHIGAVFYPELFILRLIGRLAFPIFAFFVAEGAAKTGNLIKYLLRMLGFAVLAEFPFDFAFSGTFWELKIQNVMWTFALALLAIWLSQKLAFKWPKALSFWLAGIAMMLAAFLLKTDYDAFGVLLVLSFYYFREQRGKQFGLAVFLCLYHGLAAYLTYRIFYWPLFIQSFAVVSLLFLSTYQGQRGKDFKYFFYIFYPGHLLILGLIAYFNAISG